MMKSWLRWRKVGKWLALLATTSVVLVACESDSTKSAQPSVNATVESVGVVSFGQISTFKITGNNLRTAFVTIDPFNPDRCSSLSEKIKTNTEIIFECIPNRLSVQFDIFNINGEAVKSVFATIPEPNIKFTALSTATTPKLGAFVRLNIDGDLLNNTISLPTSDKCLEISAISSSTTRVVIECIPTALDFAVTVTSLNGRVIDTKSISLPTTTAKQPLTLLANTTPVLDGPVPVVFYTKGYLEGAVTPKVSVLDSQCAGITYIKQTAAELVFSCTPKTTTTLFDIQTENDTLVDTLPMPVRQVRFDTTLGFIDVLLNADKAPITVKNFLIYVYQGYYSGTIFHRVVAGFVNQGGGFTSQSNLINGTQKTGLRAPIALESTDITGLSNTLNTLAMARTSDANSATSQFFFNVVDNSSTLDYPSVNQPGYAVFGSAVSGEFVLQNINQVSTATLSGNEAVPVTDIVINAVTPVVGDDGRF